MNAQSELTKESSGSTLDCRLATITAPKEPLVTDRVTWSGGCTKEAGARGQGRRRRAEGRGQRQVTAYVYEVLGSLQRQMMTLDRVQLERLRMRCTQLHVQHVYID
jgi:hypothetical protein